VVKPCNPDKEVKEFEKWYPIQSEPTSVILCKPDSEVRE
jgi:hypothetical protein